MFQRASLAKCTRLGGKTFRPKIATNAASKTHYDVLGVSSDASDQDIKSAFRKLALKCHPDVNKETAAQKTFMKAKAAYEVLSDTGNRAAYDRELQMGASMGSWDVRTAGAGFDLDESSLEELLRYMGGVMVDPQEMLHRRGMGQQIWVEDDDDDDDDGVTFVINNIHGFDGLSFMHTMGVDQDDEEDHDIFAGFTGTGFSSSNTSKRSARSPQTNTRRRRRGAGTKVRAAPRAVVEDEDDPMAIISEILENLPVSEQKAFLRELNKVETEEELVWLVNKYQSATSHSYHAREAQLFQQLDDMFGKNHWKHAGSRHSQTLHDVPEMFEGGMWEVPRAREPKKPPTRSKKTGRRKA